MIGTQDDITRRLKAVLPNRWFGDETPVLDAALGGLSSVWSWAYDLLSFTAAQTRIATATGIWLDMIARDCFGARIARKPGQSDESLRGRVQRELLRARGTRAALIELLTELTGRSPIVFEPARPADTGAWCVGASYGGAGAWGSLSLPYQCFVTAFRPRGTGIALVGGWAAPAGGYGQGALEYASLDMVEGQVTDADINDAVASVMPAATVAWTRISN
jgi:hypothetical protein